MPVYLPTAVIGNDNTLVTLGQSGEIMGWFYPSKDHAQNIYQCMPCVYFGQPHQGNLHWTYGDEWQRHQYYLGDSNVLVTELTSHARSESAAYSGDMRLTFTDVLMDEGATLLRRIEVKNVGTARLVAGVFCFGDWNMGGIRTGNGVRYDRAENAVVQWHRDVSVALGGDALEEWQCGKAGMEWGSNALKSLASGVLWRQDLEIGDVNWAFGFNVNLHAGEGVTRTAIYALGHNEGQALSALRTAKTTDFEEQCARRRKADEVWLRPGLAALAQAAGTDKQSGETGVEPAGALLPAELQAAYRRSLLCLPLLCGVEGVAVAAPEFDPEFISCGGYGYFWPRDGGEYVSGLIDAGYPQFASLCFDWCARTQDQSGLWHQRYFLNGQPGPNWCLPPDMLQIDQVGAVLWALGKAESAHPDSVRQGGKLPAAYQEMMRRAADYLSSRLTTRGVHGNAFDTWETFIGSFTYSNAAIYAAFKATARLLDDDKYEAEAQRVKNGVLTHFVRDDYLIRGFDSQGHDDITIDSASLGAIEPFRLLDLNDDFDLRIAEGLLRIITERLDVEWEGGRAIRRFEGDAYVGGVPACVNTLWMARCCLAVAGRLRELGRSADAAELTQRAQVYLRTVLRRATPTGLLPELMQGPTGQRYWAAPHGWAMASFVSGVLMLAEQLSQD
jgi:oligosaccharide amylase